MALYMRLHCVWLVILLNVSLISGNQLIQLDENDWDRMLTGEWMVEFFAPWCPACKNTQKPWEDFSTWSKDLGLSVAQVDVTKSPGLSGRFMVTALPTILHVHDGVFRHYKGARDKESFITFIEEKKWKRIEPIPLWKYPASTQMGILANFFKLSQVLRSIHNKFLDEYGLPSWGSYVIFALVTIVLGAILGLIMVICLDFIYPRKVPSQKEKEGKITPRESEEEVGEDELVDDVANSGDSVRKRKVPKAD